MSLTKSSLQSIPTSYATVSLGTPSDPLPQKLRAIASAGFDAIELGFPDLLSFANSRSEKEVGNYDYDDLCLAAEEVRKLCGELGLKVLVLQPFANWEGWAEGSEGKKDAERRADGWVRIMKAVGTDMLQVRYQFLPVLPMRLLLLSSPSPTAR